MPAKITEFETKSMSMRRVHLMELQAPAEDVERIMAAVARIDPLAMGTTYDNNAFQTAPGVERYRPRDGAAAGKEEAVRERPGVVALFFETSGGQDVAAEIVEAVYQVHSYQEPVIRITECLSSRTKGLDDSDNPHRWWNTTGDWKNGA
ncbi:MAG: hypothetical protein R3E44_08370 [Paracoccaceae bacterium]